MTFNLLNGISEDRIYSDQVNTNAELAMLYDAQLPESLFAKTAFYMFVENKGQFAIPYLEHSLRYNPNFALAIRNLEGLYLFQDTEKYLYYPLKANQLDIKGKSRGAIAFDYLNLSRAFRYVGFFDEAEKYLNKALEFESEPEGSLVERVELLSDTESDYDEAWNLLTDHIQKLDSPSENTFRFAAQTSYFRRD